MKKRKPIRMRGKLSLSQYFQDFKEGDRVAVVREHSLNPKFPKQIQGRSGIVVSQRGESYLVNIMDIDKEKTYIIHPTHLKRLKS